MEYARIKRQACLSVAEFTQEIVDNIGIVGVPFLAGILYFRGQVAFGAIIAAGYLANGVFSSLQESFSAYISAKSTTKLNETMLQHLQVQAAAKTEDPQTIIGRGIEVNLGGQVIKYPDFTIKAGEKVLLTPNWSKLYGHQQLLHVTLVVGGRALSDSDHHEPT